MLAVGDQAGISVGGLGMALRPRGALAGGTLPEDLAGSFVQGVNVPRLLGHVVGGATIPIESEAQRRSAFGADGADHKKFVVPHYGAGVAEAGNGRLPTDIGGLSGGRVRVPVH